MESFAPGPAIGPYELQDFTLFYTLRYGFRPSKIAFLALHAWGDVELPQRAECLPPQSEQICRLWSRCARAGPRSAWR